MIKELKYLFFLIIIFFFIFFTARYYFSDENIKKSYRSLSSIDKKINNIEKDLILLENDTENIIEYIEFIFLENKIIPHGLYFFKKLISFLVRYLPFIPHIKDL